MEKNPPTDPAKTLQHINTCKIMVLPHQPEVVYAEMAGSEPETVNRLLYISETVVKVTGALDEEPWDVGGPGRGLDRLSAKGTRCGGRGQRLLPYFFMRATVTEEQQNEWPVKRNENE